SRFSIARAGGGPAPAVALAAGGRAGAGGGGTLDAATSRARTLSPPKSRVTPSEATATSRPPNALSPTPATRVRPAERRIATERSGETAITTPTTWISGAAAGIASARSQVSMRDESKLAHRRRQVNARRITRTSAICGPASLADPYGQGLGRDFTAGNGEGQVGERFVVGFQLMAVDGEEELGRHRAHALVPVHERVIHHEGVHQGRRLRGEIGIEVVAAERHLRLGRSRFEPPPVPDPCGASERPKLDLVQAQELSNREVEDHFASARYNFERRSRSSLARSSNLFVTLP